MLMPMVASVPAFAACPHTDYSVRGEFKRSDIVATVVVRDVVWLDEARKPVKLKPPLSLGHIPGGLDPYVGAYYSVTLTRIYKGNPPRQFRVFSENTSARTPLKIGIPLLLFLSRTRASDTYARAGDLIVDACGNSAVESKVPERMRLLRRLAKLR